MLPPIKKPELRFCKKLGLKDCPLIPAKRENKERP